MIKIINLYIDVIKTYLNINDDNLIISLFEKDGMKDLEDIYKVPKKYINYLNIIIKNWIHTFNNL